MNAVALSDTAAATATAFMDACRSHDVERMVELCVDSAGFRYVPYQVDGRQRVVQGNGSAHAIGKALWTSMIDAFPDLCVDVRWMTADEDGNVAMEVVLQGTQARVFGPFGSIGSHFDLAQLFMFKVNRAGLEDLSAYWDMADWYEQLGRFELDAR